MKMIVIWPGWWSKVRCETCRGSGQEDCGCDGSNPDCFCKGTKKLTCSICGGARKL